MQLFTVFFFVCLCIYFYTMFHLISYNFIYVFLHKHKLEGLNFIPGFGQMTCWTQKRLPLKKKSKLFLYV